LARAFEVRQLPRVRAALPLAEAERLPVSFEYASMIRPTALSTKPPVLSRDADFIASPLPNSKSFTPATSGDTRDMTIGTSIFLIALGAILKFAVNATVAGFSIQTAGVILMVAGVIGLIIGLFLLMSRRPADADRTVYEDRVYR
jgi:Domain of unknown function (DUF6458)